jgi:hypothetical protein
MVLPKPPRTLRQLPSFTIQFIRLLKISQINNIKLEPEELPATERMKKKTELMRRSLQERKPEEVAANRKGRLIHADGDVYNGEFKNDMANGYGEYTHINGSKYKGEFKDDVQEGHGEEEWIDGAKYVGSYMNGMKHGYGVYKWANTSLYKGNWE